MVSDITYVSTEEGWLYLAGQKDICTGELVGHAMSERMTKDLVSRSLYRAVAAKRPGKGRIHHSDRSCQYYAHDYRRLLDQYGIEASMSRRGNCYDNAPMESFWGTLKNELINHRRYRTRQEEGRRSPSISKYSTTDRDGRNAWDIHPPLPMKRSFMKRD